MRVIAATIILFILALAPEAQAQPRIQCPTMDAPIFNLNVDNRPVRIIPNADQNRMRQLYTRHNPGRAAGLTSHHSIGGLHHGEITLRTQFNMLQATQGSAACLGLQSLDMTLVYDPIIYISSDRPRGSCEYNAALEHEYKHHNTDLLVLRQAAPLLRAAAQRSISSLRLPLQTQTSQLAQAREQLQQQITDQLNLEMDRIERQRNQRQALIDTPAEYQRVASICPTRR